MMRSENGQLLNYVTLNVRGRDIVGFVDEAQRVVSQKVKLPEGVHIEWSGEFEHQVRAARTLRFVFPAVLVLIFVILYMTYHDLGREWVVRRRSPEYQIVALAKQVEKLGATVTVTLPAA